MVPRNTITICIIFRRSTILDNCCRTHTYFSSAFLRAILFRYSAINPFRFAQVRLSTLKQIAPGREALHANKRLPSSKWYRGR